MRKSLLLVGSASAAMLLLGSAAALAEPARTADGGQPTSAPAQRHDARPNVVIWMLDDVGFAQLSSYGGLVATPNIDRVAKMGLRYSNYHTAPICSASRASLLSGRMPHSVHIGGHATAARNQPGYDARIPASAGSLAENLRQAGYVNFAIGKWDHLPDEHVTPAGPFNQWPTGQGFDRFYGFLAADADNWTPTLMRELSPIATPAVPDYHLNADMADQAISMIGTRDAGNHRRPFFLYWATSTAHAPHHAPSEWIDRYKGKFDKGWDVARETILKAQKAKGLLPKETVLSPRPDGMPAWNSLGATEKKLFARQMEVFAASLSYADAQFGRILDELQARGELDNTIVVITSDNGASAEGGEAGLYNEAETTSPKRPDIATNMALYDKWGGPGTYPHYAVGWAVAGDTPFRYYKQTAHEGGTRVPFVVAWPKGIAARGELRNQFVHVADVAPTILDMAGVPLAPVVNNVPQTPMEGQSALPTFAKSGDPRAGRPQYVEMYGNKGLWSDGWSLVTSHRLRTWDWKVSKTFDEPWELYDLVKDPGQVRDLAAQHPERVAKMSRLFDEQAKRYNVYPLYNMSDSMADRAAQAKADFERRDGKWHYAAAVGNIKSTNAPPIVTRDYRMTAQLDLADNAATLPIFAFGGQLGGIGLYLESGKPTFVMNGLDGRSASATSTAALGAGASQLELDFRKVQTHADGTSDYRISVSSGGKAILDDVLRFAIPTYFGLPETFGVGEDAGSPVLSSYDARKPNASRVSNIVFDFASDAGSKAKAE